MKKLGYFFFALSLLLSHGMCVVVAWSCRDMLCGIAHSCYSAPASTAFLYLIPFGAGIAVCGALGWYFLRKEK